MSTAFQKINPPIYKGKKELIWTLPCIAPNKWGHDCCEKIDCAHVKKGLYAGGNVKNDKRILPMCRVHHSIQHSKGEAEFYRKVFPKGINDAYELADLLHCIYLEGQLRLITEPERAAYEACERFVTGV